jgi:hypothetical protein
MDDASSISQLTPSIINKDLHVFSTLPTKPLNRGWLDGLWGDKFFGAANAPTGLNISYWLKEKSDDGVTIKVENDKGKTVANLTGPAARGINRVTWDMQPESKIRLPNQGEEGTIYVPAGTYNATITLGSSSETVKLTVLPYPYNATLSLGRRDR